VDSLIVLPWFFSVAIGAQAVAERTADETENTLRATPDNSQEIESRPR
jgi:hypothetical protein